MFTCFLIVLLTIANANASFLDFSQAQTKEKVAGWADKIGSELLDLGKTITKLADIERNYEFLNAKVEAKNPEKLLKEVVTDIERMMTRKMIAIRCIAKKAEEAAANFVFNTTDYQYYSSKYSNMKLKNLPESIREDAQMYLNMTFNNDTHFYNLAVNTSHSTVHVPTNIYDKHDEPAKAIQWSESLDDVFVQNYKSDPALSWQYFGSTSGIMRHYPGKKWKDVRRDTFDCRIVSWFIEAATCTKDVVILVDNSGSMDGFGEHIARLTVGSVLDTLSNNDYINVLYYNDSTNFTIPCYEDMLVQATPENIDLFKKAIKEFEPSGKTQPEQALEIAFNLLSRVRSEIRKCNDTSPCNQAIMIITDGISRNLSELVIYHNYLQDGNDIPVRLFTYLIGKEVENVPDILWMACANRGYYSHVQTLERVTASVLKYINVIARPLVLQGKERPISWTHAHVDLNYDDKNDNTIDEKYRLLTSVAVPVFDTKDEDNDTLVADLLGVAATDVPLADIERLTLPYKIGVNGYAFVVSNNGYLLMHPDLRPDFEGNLRVNYNSIDLTEVEQFDNNLEARDLNDDTLLKLRELLVNGLRDKITNVSIKYHYDDRKRVTRAKYHYYTAPLKGTPFSIAFAIPDVYGLFHVKVGDVEEKFSGYNLLDLFKGSNWKIHPKWVYCKYHYLEGHEFKTPEEELKHFLNKMKEGNFTWQRQYEKDPGKEGDVNDLDNIKCFGTNYEDDAYYCDKELFQRLIFDANNTLGAFHEFKNGSNEPMLFERFNATLRFVATMSGLTRWLYISKELEIATKKEFGHWHKRAIDEDWYKSAVIQHQIEADSFVYALNSETEVITGSYAIFHKNFLQMAAPGSVVGFQFGQQQLRKRFKEIIDLSVNIMDKENATTESLENLKFYIIDHNGYIIISLSDPLQQLGAEQNVSRFFGEVEGDVLHALLMSEIFERFKIYDFQAVCTKDDYNHSSDASTLFTPFNYLRYMFDWLIMKTSYLLLDTSFRDWFEVTAESTTLVLEEEEDVDDEDEDEEEAEDRKGNREDYDEHHEPCDKYQYIYVLDQKKFIGNNLRDDVTIVNSTKIFYINKLHKSNLVLIAIDDSVSEPNEYFYTSAPRIIDYGDSIEHPCQKLNLNNLTRRRLSGCFNEHPKESLIKDCGGGAAIEITSSVFFICILFILLSV